MKLGVVYPWASPFIWTKFVDSVLNLERPATAHDYLGKAQALATRFFRGVGWCPAKRHLDGCEKALTWGADLLCIIGSDQTYEEDMLCRLVARWDEGYEVVAALVPTRGYIPTVSMKPFQPVAYRLPYQAPGNVTLQQFENLEEYVTIVDPADGDIQPIDFAGSGVVMFHKDHLLALKQPWFYETVQHETQARLACMDTKFFWRLRTEAGARTWVDTTILVKHVTDMEIDRTFQHRFEDWATEEPWVP